MDGFSIPAMTTITDVVKLIRGRSARSKYIHDLVMNIKAEQEEIGTLTLLSQTLEEFVGIKNMDIAMTVFNLYRFGANEQQLAGNSITSLWSFRQFIHSNAWNVMRYYTETLLDWKRLQEFLELADNICHLSTVFAAMPQPYEFWPKLLSNIETATIHSVTYQDEAANRASRYYLRKVRFRLWLAVCRNPPGSKPTDLDGDEINKDYFAKVQGELWRQELQNRSTQMLLQHWKQRVPRNEAAQILLMQWAIKNVCTDVAAFCRLVRIQRLILTADDIGIQSHKHMAKLGALLGWSELEILGNQGLADCLPSAEDNYKMQFLFQLSTACTQVKRFWNNFEGKDNVTWYDGWIEKYPVSGSIEHVALDIDYSALEVDEEEVDDIQSAVMQTTVVES
ncbi:hypothetical protein FHETE_7575 [Fusarium heterosporum]|uniref:Uncharacterized protein n=1 Tax=Fusarium heterosporum TaxID=42747 RepID=A0A8H5T5X9_FUSHE|nr:hypothetical protein FHETE_7575 [Fusarium heterosporum]